ncbi:MAG: hypothetical protein Q4G05_00470 [Clostridia bacterium]|nr:hypothetical protein [Clostridia bacterium]
MSKNCGDTIIKKNQEAIALKESGYEIYTRNIQNPYYKIENIDNFFLDKDGNLNIIYAYGNQNYTAEFDIIKL